MLVDELDSSLHSTISAEVVHMFADPEANPRGAQMLFTTHDVTLLHTLQKNGMMPSRVVNEACRVAGSEDQLELWLLLHFQEFPSVAQDGENDAIIEKLRAAHRAFTDYGKRNKRISLERFAALEEADGIRKAVRRARSLSRHFTHETPSQRDPSTEVYLLIEALGVVPPAS